STQPSPIPHIPFRLSQCSSGSPAGSRRGGCCRSTWAPATAASLPRRRTSGKQSACPPPGARCKRPPEPGTGVAVGLESPPDITVAQTCLQGFQQRFRPRKENGEQACKESQS